ncbi:MAG: PLP-dependent aminotransferase family protein [Clostridia bacterium]|nr:PLP-dependent aminotransferase family protein [Clostridia bacterium]
MLKKAEPKYLKLYRTIAGDIAAGVYKTGDKLPSKRTLSDKYSLSLVTVEHALEALSDEGYVTPVERKGYFVSYTGSQGQYSLPASGNRLHPAEPMRAEELPGPAFPFSAWAKTVRQTLSERQRKIFERSPNQGHEELRTALSEFLARSRNIRCSAGQIVVGSGSAYLYERLIQTLGRERIYAIESPSYHMIERVYSAGNVSYEMLKIGQDGILTSELERSRASVLHITPYRSFPSGVTAQAGKRAEYLSWASIPGRFIIEDDVESEFTILNNTFDPLFTLSEDGNVIYMNSFSVTLSPALRISYMILPEKIIDKYKEKAGFYPCPVPTFEQLILAGFINSGEFERYINRVRREKRASARGTHSTL